MRSAPFRNLASTIFFCVRKNTSRFSLQVNFLFSGWHGCHCFQIIMKLCHRQNFKVKNRQGSRFLTSSPAQYALAFPPNLGYSTLWAKKARLLPNSFKHGMNYLSAISEVTCGHYCYFFPFPL